MEAKIRGKCGNVCCPVVSDLKEVEKKNLEWDLNDWSWDGDLFTASPLNPVPSDCRSKQLFHDEPEIPANAGLSKSSSSSDHDGCLILEKGKRGLEKRRRTVVVEHEKDDAGSLNLKLGGQLYPIMDEGANSGKKPKITATASNHAVCQVVDCRADLSNAKDYHRRHKVCDMHSKASKALVGNVMQRFCQQCSRFHILQEFDEGKRSCRRRLAGHNKRRRKTHPETVVNGGSLNDERGSSYLLLSLIRILSNLHANSSDQTRDQDLLSHLLRNLANLDGASNGRSISGLLQESQGLVNTVTNGGTVEKVRDVAINGPECINTVSFASKKDDCTSSQNILKSLDQCETLPAAGFAQKRMFACDAQGGTSQALLGSKSTVLLPSGSTAKANEPEAMVEKIIMNNIDLNNDYDESHDVEYLDKFPVPLRPGTGSITCPSWVQSNSHKKNPEQMSGNTDSTYSLSPSSSSGEAQSRTDRIVLKLFGKDPSDFPNIIVVFSSLHLQKFLQLVLSRTDRIVLKLFGKDPSDFPIALRKQILDWLSHSPSDIESYIRPGCIILTIYLRMGKHQWEEICLDLGASLSKLDESHESFWRTGWIYARVQNCVSFIYNGQVVLNTPLPLKSHVNCRISSIRPIAVSLSEKTQFVAKGFNIFQPTTRLLCAFEGNYLVQQSCYDLMDDADVINYHDKLQCLSFSCSVPNFVGRGFIEVEDHGLSSCFFPFIVAEQEVCSEIRVLEDTIEVTETADDMCMEARNQALDFLHEMGWLLHRSRSKFRLGNLDPNLDLFSLRRFKWVMNFSIDHDWCAVVKKLLVVLFDGIVDAGEHFSVELALLDMGLLHRAVRRNCRPMVDLLLQYIPERTGHSQNQQDGVDHRNVIFKPDAVGPAGLTPLHVAASMFGSEIVLDALTDDPELLGIKAWKQARDNTGLTPNDYAYLRGHYSYIHLVQRKIKKKSDSVHVVLDIPSNLSDFNGKQKDGMETLKKVGNLQLEKSEVKAAEKQCKVCEQRLGIGAGRTSLVYRPAMLSMVAIAAVCVCVALLFKSCPEVLYVFRPFRWELLKYGSS